MRRWGERCFTRCNGPRDKSGFRSPAYKTNDPARPRDLSPPPSRFRPAIWARPRGWAGTAPGGRASEPFRNAFLFNAYVALHATNVFSAHPLALSHAGAQVQTKRGAAGRGGAWRGTAWRGGEPATSVLGRGV